jgi:hypothetical protein
MATPEEELQNLRQQNLELLKALDEARQRIIEIDKKRPILPNDIVIRQIVPPMPSEPPPSL